MTALASALKRAGVDTDAVLLNRIAVDLLRRNELSPRRAMKEFVEEVRDGGGLMVALVSVHDTECAAIEYLERVARDMRGSALKVSAKAESGAKRVLLQGLTTSAPLTHSSREDASGLSSRANDGLKLIAARSVSRDEREGEARGRMPEKAMVEVPSPKVDDEGAIDAMPGQGYRPFATSSSQSSGVGAIKVVPEKASLPLPRPGNAKRSLDHLRAIKQAVPTVFDTVLLRDQLPIGELRYSQLDRYIASNTREAALLKLIRDHGRPADPNARIKEIISVETLQRFVRKAAEVADAA